MPEMNLYAIERLLLALAIKQKKCSKISGHIDFLDSEPKSPFFQ